MEESCEKLGLPCFVRNLVRWERARMAVRLVVLLSWIRKEKLQGKP